MLSASNVYSALAVFVLFLHALFIVWVVFGAFVTRSRPSGGDIIMHGVQNGLGWLGPLHRALDWIDGCIAVTDAEIEEIYAAVLDGTPVEIQR